MVALWLIEPLVAVTVTVNVPLLVVDGTFMVSVEEPEFVIDDGFRVAVNPPPEVVAARATVPLNWFRADIVIFEVPCDPLLTFRLLGEDEMEKSGLATTTVTVVAWLRSGLIVSVAVTVTVYVPLAVPAGAETARVEVPGAEDVTLIAVVIVAHEAAFPERPKFNVPL